MKILTRTPEIEQENNQTFFENQQDKAQKEIQPFVDERGFYLYEWISQDEFKTSIRLDYLDIISGILVPMAILAFIVGIFNIAYAFVALVAFFGIALVILLFKTFYKSYLYTKGANIVITDNHIISSGNVIPKNQIQEKQSYFQSIVKNFHEEMFGDSNLEEGVGQAKRQISERVKFLQQQIGNLGTGSRYGEKLAAIGFLVGLGLFLLMGVSYYIGLPIVFLIGLIFSKISHAVMLLTNKEAYSIQAKFQDINENSNQLQAEQEKSTQLLTDAKDNKWMKNLSGKLQSSFNKINIFANATTKQSIALRKQLENSEYKDIFNFQKYDTWIKNQVLNPIKELIKMLVKNENILTNTIQALEEQITETSDPSLQKPLILQKQRLEIQISEIKKMHTLLEGYQSKLS